MKQGEDNYFVMADNTGPKLSAPMASVFSPGDILDNRYEITRQLGKGTAGLVYEAKDRLAGGRRLALKVFHRKLAASTVARSRIAREVLLGISIEHPSLVRIYDLVITDHVLGYTMELVEGTPLSDLNPQCLSFNEIASILSHVGQGLAALHKHGIVHRDLKPANIIIRDDGMATIIDLGLARGESLATSEPPIAKGTSTTDQVMSQSRCTSLGEVLGTPAYMAPEYIAQGQCDRRSDIYALGAIAYELLTGEWPHKTDEIGHLFLAKVEKDPPPPAKIRPSIPEALSNLVMRALHRDPTRRLPSAEAFVGGLLYYITNERDSSARQAAEMHRSAQAGMSLIADTAAYRGARLKAVLIRALVVAFLVLSAQYLSQNLPSRMASSLQILSQGEGVIEPKPAAPTKLTQRRKSKPIAGTKNFVAKRPKVHAP